VDFEITSVDCLEITWDCFLHIYRIMHASTGFLLLAGRPAYTSQG